MTVVTASIIFVFFAGYIGFQAIKNFHLRSLNKALADKDFETVEKLSNMSSSRRFLGDYTCDLYCLRAYYLDQDISGFETQLQKMLGFTYKNLDDKKSFLELYFHTFLLKDNRKYADWLLEGIRETGDTRMIKYCEQAYAVMLDHRNDLIDEMDAQIDSKLYYGFSLGVILYMLGKQYESIGDVQKAIISFQNALVCFRPRAVYVSQIKKDLDRLGAPVTDDQKKGKH